MSKRRNGGSRFKDLEVVPGSGNRKLAAGGVQPAFDGMIASACELGINLKDFIEMTRLARTSDPRVARFLDGWDAVGTSEQQARGAADAVCNQVGLTPMELLRVAAEVGYRFAMCGAQIRAALALPSVVERSIETALTAEGIADRKMLFQHAGFLPTPKTSQTAYSAIRNAHGNTSEQVPAVSAPPPESTIRRMVDRFNEARGLPRTPPPALPEKAIDRALSISIPENGDTMPVEVPEEEEGDGE